MIASVDTYLDRVPHGDYDCISFAVEAWEGLIGTDLSGALHRTIYRKEATPLAAGRFRRVAAPISPCLVVLRVRGRRPHIGIFLRGRILHLSSTGAQFMRPDTVTAQYQSVRYYVCSFAE